MANGQDTIDSFAALGDPSRRLVFERVAAAPSAVGEIARGLPISRPAVSQHLRVLKAAGLVRESAHGTRRIYRVDPHGLAVLRAWVDSHWVAALAAFAAYADQDHDNQHQETDP